MSIKLMTDAWKTSLQTSQKIVLLALCDNANDHGECYPSIATIAQKCSMSERNVFYVIAQLHKMELVSKVCRKGRSTLYTIHPCKFFTPEQNAPLHQIQEGHASASPSPMNALHDSPETVSPITINKPLSESSTKPSIKKTTQPIEKPADVEQSVWDDYLLIRKTKKSPMTPTALKMLLLEVERSGKTINEALMVCCQRGWLTYKSEWDTDAMTLHKTRDLPLITNEQIEHAYRVECNKDPAKARFGSYFEMKKYILDFREKQKTAT